MLVGCSSWEAIEQLCWEICYWRRNLVGEFFLLNTCVLVYAFIKFSNLYVSRWRLIPFYSTLYLLRNSRLYLFWNKIGINLSHLKWNWECNSLDKYDGHCNIFLIGYLHSPSRICKLFMFRCLPFKFRVLTCRLIVL